MKSSAAMNEEHHGDASSSHRHPRGCLVSLRRKSAAGGRSSDRTPSARRWEVVGPEATGDEAARAGWAITRSMMGRPGLRDAETHRESSNTKPIWHNEHDAPLSSMPTIDSSPSSRTDSSAHSDDQLFQLEGHIRMNKVSSKLKDEPQVTVQPLSKHGEFTTGAILRGQAGHLGAITPFEKKAALVNMELDRMGMGRYQICVWFLCGFGYLLDLMWAQAFGLVATPIYQEMNVTGGATGYIFTAFSVGLTVGAFTFGLAVDIIGRRWAFNLTCLLTCVFGMLVAAPVNNYNAICAITALCGFGLGGQIPIDATITLEYLPQNRRFLLTLLSVWQPVGVVVCSAIAYGFVPRYRCAEDLLACPTVAEGEPCCNVASNMGWRYLMITLGAITLSVFLLRFVLFKFYESPKFLIGKGKDQEAIDVLHKIAKFNRVAAPVISIRDFEAIENEASSTSTAGLLGAKGTAQATKEIANDFKSRIGHLKGLFESRVSAFTLVVLWLAYIGDFWSFNIAGSYLPIILARFNASSGSGTPEDTYRQYVIIYIWGIPGVLLAMLAVQLPLVGRKWSLVFGAAIQGLSMVLYTQAKTTKLYVILNALEYAAQSFFNAILYATSPELFPAYVRGSACGLASTLGRLSGIVAPFAASRFIEQESNGVLWLAVGGIWLSMVVLVFLPIETRNRPSY